MSINDRIITSRGNSGKIIFSPKDGSGNLVNVGESNSAGAWTFGKSGNTDYNTIYEGQQLN
jgi:hypothetical protein